VATTFVRGGLKPFHYLHFGFHNYFIISHVVFLLFGLLIVGVLIAIQWMINWMARSLLLVLDFAYIRLLIIGMKGLKIKPKKGCPLCKFRPSKAPCRRPLISTSPPCFALALGDPRLGMLEG